MRVETLQKAKASLQVLSTIVKAAPIPEPFKSAVVGIPDAVLQIISIVETAKGNMEDAKILAVYIATITDRTIHPLDLPRVPSTTQDRIREFQEALQQITDEITTLASRRSLRKWIINYDRDASTLGALKQKVMDVIAGFQLETVVDTDHKVELLYQEQQNLIRRQQELEINQLIALLGIGDSGSSKKPPCMEGTRVSLLKWISRWIQAPVVDGRRGLCLIGAAGRGKSSVGASVAEDERTSRRLGADFYFTTDQQDRNEGVIPVLARQLASWANGRLRTEIASAVHADRDLAQRLLEVQFQKLIQEPLETLTDDPDCPTLVILFDGLDECKDEYAGRLLHLIGQSFAKLPSSVKFIITSRPEQHLLSLYDRDPLKPLLVIRSLDLEDAGDVRDDIKGYFKQVLPPLVWNWVKSPSNWPDEERLEKLVSLSGDLWIWAATVARMLADSNIRDPERQLNALLSYAPDPHQPYGHVTDLYVIYSKILERACPPAADDRLVTSFRNVLGALCVTEELVNIETLTSLLHLDHPSNEDFTHYIRTRVLGYLQAVLIVPEVDEENPSPYANPIRFIHKSFKDYLTDGSRCDPRFLVNVAEQHGRMAIRCMRRMDDLKKPNTCNINPNMIIAKPIIIFHIVNAEVKTLVQQHISPALQYACKSWALHVSRASPDCHDVYTSMDTFARTKLLYWLEVLSLLGLTYRVQHLAFRAHSWPTHRSPEIAPNPSQSPTPTWTLPHRISTFIKEGLVKILAAIRLQTVAGHTSSNPLSLRALDYLKCFFASFLPVPQLTAPSQAGTLSRELDISASSLLQDLEQFVQEFEIPIATSPLHIYHSALAFTPPHTSLSRVYGHLATGGSVPLRGRLRQWFRRDQPQCVAWSPDGQRIVSGSKGSPLRLWDLSTGAPIGEAWKNNAYWVQCVAWSPDGKMIVSGSGDRTLQLWDSITGSRIRGAWKGHTEEVSSVAWSPDGKWVVSGSDKTLRMWDPSTGTPIGEAWKGHADQVQCVSWSPDGKRIASGSKGRDICLWDSSTGAVVGGPWMDDGAVYDLAWSPDGKTIVSANGGNTLGLWDTDNGSMIGNPWKGHTKQVTCVAWSPDGKRVISGSKDKTLHLWDSSIGEPVGDTWRGHTRAVQSVSWSPDGNSIVSACDDGLILWNSTTGEPRRLEQRGPESHARHVYRIAFSQYSDKLVSASSDGTLRVWDTSSGAPIGHPAYQTRTVTSLDFSPDGKCVVAEDEDHRIIWDVVGEAPEPEQCGPVSDDHVRVLEVNDDGWILDPQGEIMFWLPLALRPMGSWGRVLVKGNLLATETASVPIIDISAYASRM
ncbi:hypothetical protein FRB94_014059 [Tulasnella sp. JGI-2019a]|nr:hypothetical protein FRB94_014059 [Tulasnella sp. JGI-2019a]